MALCTARVLKISSGERLLSTSSRESMLSVSSMFTRRACREYLRARRACDRRSALQARRSQWRQQPWGRQLY
eukprot:3220344-Prymnesium_polylepis.1